MRKAFPFFTARSESNSFGTKGCRSGRRLERHNSTITPMLNFRRSCCSGSFLSTVTKTSKLFSASANNRPFSTLAQPIWGAVLTAWPTIKLASLRGRHSSRRTFILSCRSQQFPFGFFQQRYGLFARNSREIVQKFIKGVASLKIIEERLNGHSGSSKAWCAAHDFWI